MLAEPVDKFAVGVKTAVRDKPVPLIAPKEPPETVRSPTVPFQAKLFPGSSENVNVMFAVSPIFRVGKSEVMVTVGASVSIVREGDIPAEPVLPAASE
jgi:hypothetical protein